MGFMATQPSNLPIGFQHFLRIPGQSAEDKTASGCCEQSTAIVRLERALCAILRHSVSLSHVSDEMMWNSVSVNMGGLGHCVFLTLGLAVFTACKAQG